MGSTRDEAVQLFNDATLTAEATEKVDKLQSLKELILNKDIQLLQVFLPELAVLQADSAPAVRKFLPEFLEACPPAALQPASLLLVLQCLQGLLQDSVPAVVKAAVMASSSLFRTALAVVAGQSQTQQGAQAVTSLWQNAGTLRNSICSFAGNHKVPGVRLNATKFMEQVVLTFTAENVPVLSPGAKHIRQQPMQSLHGILTSATLMREAETHLGQLVNMLRAPGVATLPGAVAIVAVKAAGSIAQQRPFFMNKVLPVLIALGSAQEAGPSTGGVQKSVKTGVANALLAMLRCTAAEAVPWRRKIVDALKALGAGTQAEAEMRRIERQGKRAREADTAPAAPPLKQAKLEPTLAPSQQIKQEPTAVVNSVGVGIKPESAVVRPEGAAAVPLQAGGPGDQKRYQQLQQHAAQHQQQQQQPAKPLRQALGTVHIPDATPESELSQVLAILGALAAEYDKSTLVAVLQGLSPQVLADCVIANMAHLPPADTIAGTGTSSGLAGLMQGLQQQQNAAKAQQAGQAGPRQPTDPRTQDPRLRPQPQQPHQQPGPPAPLSHPPHLDPQPALQPQGAPGEPVPAPPPGNPGDVEIKPSLQELKSEPGGLRAGTPSQIKQETKVPIPVIPKVPPQVRAANLSSQQQLSLRRSAIHRILANGNTPSQETRIALLSRLATQSPAGDGIGDEILQHMFRDYHTNHGHELALTWLFALYKEHSTQTDIAKSTVSGLADVESGAAARRAVKAESAAEPASGRTDSEMGVGASDAWVRKREGGANSGPSGMDIDGLEGVEADEAAASTGSKQQQGRASSKPAGAQSGHLAGTPYESVLLALLEGLRENLPANDKAIAQILLEVPALPGPGVGLFLAEVAGMGGEWATLALSSARDIIINRPPNRSEALQVVLDAASGNQADTRNKAVRLIANKLFAQPQLQDSIEKFACRMLFRLTTTPPSSADAPVLGVVKTEQPQLQTPQATAATSTEPSSDPQASSQQQLQHQSEEEGTRLSGLYCALCTKKQPLLRDLLLVYGRAADGCKGAIEAVAAGLARSIGPHAAALVDLVQDTPPDSQKLLLQMLHVLTEQGPLSGQLTQACVAKFESSKDALFLVPAIPGMQRAQVLQVFPRLLELGPGQFKAALHRLIMPLPSSGQAMMTAAEVFISLHSIDATKDGVPLRKVMACLDPCMKEDMRSTFPPEAMAVALQQLVTRNPLPPLFMRFTIQTLNAAPRLKAFVLDILSSLVSKQVWTHGQQWKGWIMCSKQLVPDSFPALLQLPTQQFGAALAEMSSGVKMQLSQYAKAPSCPVAVPRTTLILLQEVESAVAASSLNPAQADIGSSPVVNNIARTPSLKSAIA
ncbi:TPA: hypothetical protein ACH3X1_000717 [Trebouxia sp. C0004]